MEACPPLRAFLLGAAVLWVLAASNARAQIYRVSHRPPDVEYFQLSSPNFRFIYQAGMEDEAREMAAILESRLPEVRAVVGLRRKLNAPIVLNSFSDRSGGFVTPLPFRQEIEVPALRTNILSPRFASWFETVAPHELVHAAHAESGSGIGYGWLLRKIGPDLARTLNLSGPRGMSEGAAVWYESRFRPGAGRLNHSIFRMEFRAAMLSEKPLNLTQMLEPSEYTRPFDRYYHGGGHLFAYMAEHGDLDFFRRARNFYYRLPSLGYGPALWYGTRTFPYTLGRRLRRHYIREGEAFVSSLGEFTEAETIASGRGASFRRAKWIDDRTLLVYARGYDLRPGFYSVDVATGRRRLVANETLTEDGYFSLSPDRSAVLFARYVPDALESLRWISEIFRLDVRSGETKRLTRGGRAYAPVEAVGGTIWVLRNEGQYNVWSELRQGNSHMGRLQPQGSRIRAIEPSPDATTVAVVLNLEGQQGIYRSVGGGVLEPWIVLPEASVYEASWSSDSRFLFFTADPGGVTNVYAWEASRDRILKVTNVPFGAFEPSLSPDGTTLAFTNYRHERFELVQMPFRPDESAVFSEELHPVMDTPEAEPITAVETTSPTRYSGWRNVRPRVLYPFVFYEKPSDDDDIDMGIGVGAGLEWTDPLQKWAAQTGLFYQKETVWGRFFVQSGGPVVRPGFEIYRRPSTVSVLTQGTGGRLDTVRVGRDERGVGIGMSLPVTLQSNVFQSRASASVSAEYRQERRFDDDGETLRPWEDRVAIRPAASFSYRVQTNSRDIVPNTGWIVSSASRLDVWSEKEPARWFQTRSSLFLPFLRRSNTGIEVSTTIHAQNRGGLIDLSYFFPRGYENNADYLGKGVFAKHGVEVTQPIWYIDNGFFLFPLYFRSMFLYGFAETLQQLGGPGTQEPLTVAGAGVGVEMRFLHSINFTLRFAPVYQFEPNEWDWTLR